MHWRRTMEQTRQDDKLYQQTLSSLRQLNEEIFLNDLQKMMGRATDELKNEIYEMMQDIKKQHGQLSRILNTNGQSSVESLNASNQKIEEMLGAMSVYSGRLEKSLDKTLHDLKNDSSETMMKYEELTRGQLEQYYNISKSWEEQWSTWTEEHEGRMARLDALKEEIQSVNEEWETTTERFADRIDEGNRMSESNIAVLNRCLLEIQDETKELFTSSEHALKRMELRHQQRMEIQMNDFEQSMTNHKTLMRSHTKETDEKLTRMNQLIESLRAYSDDQSERQEQSRQMHLENILEGQIQSSHAVEEIVRAEIVKIESKSDNQNKQTRLFFGGVIILSITQIVIHFV